MFEPGQVAQLAQSPEVRARRFGIGARGRNRHQPTDAHAVEARDGVEQRLHLVGPRAALLCLLAEVDLDERVHRPAGGLGPPIDLLGQVEAVHGLDAVEEMDGILGLIGLQMPDEVPGHRMAQRLDLVLGFLDAVLAERGGPRLDGGFHPLGRHCLRNRDEEDAVGGAPGSPARGGNHRLYPLEVGPDIGRGLGVHRGSRF